MPIDNNLRRVFEIDGNPQLQRYLSLEKFISMLQRSSLFFTRIDRLEDNYEGISPKVVRLGLKAFYEHQNKRGFFTVPMTEDVINKNIERHEAETEKHRALFVVNCWHKNEIENALMWKSYSANNNGIMIRSDYRRICDSLNETENSIQISLIKYADFDNDRTIDFGNMLHPIIYKRHFYSSENEIRLIHQVSNKQWVHDWENEESQDGIYVSVKVEELIKEIVVAPLAPEWYLDVVKSVCEKFELLKPVLRSSLA